MEKLEVDIGDLKNAYARLIEELNDLQDVESFKRFEELNEIAEEVNDLRIEKERELEEKEEDMFFESQKEQWEREQIDLENEYWRTQL